MNQDNIKKKKIQLKNMYLVATSVFKNNKHNNNISIIGWSVRNKPFFSRLFHKYF